MCAPSALNGLRTIRINRRCPLEPWSSCYTGLTGAELFWGSIVPFALGIIVAAVSVRWARRMILRCRRDS